jgi:ubiquinone/menaquinone biosynthesis C-methylase UbiE
MEKIVGEVISESRRVVKKGGNVYIISSFKLDKQTMRGKVIPLLKKKKIPYAITADSPFEYIKIKA